MKLDRRAALLSGLASVAAMQSGLALALTVSGRRLPSRMGDVGDQLLARAQSLGMSTPDRGLADTASVIDFAQIVLAGLATAKNSQQAELARNSAGFLSRVVALNKDAHPSASRAQTRGFAPPFASLKDEYAEDFDSCVVAPEHRREIAKVAAFITSDAARSRYQEIEAATDVPWFVIGAIHYREAGSNFLGHLHNGDPLAKKTFHVPKGRPPGLWPPSPWDAREAFRLSAIDALKEFNGITSWTVERMLFGFEAYNGWGYRSHRINSPYLWSFSNLYTKGGYSSDSHYDPNYVSKQVGLGLIVRAVANSNAQQVHLAREP